MRYHTKIQNEYVRFTKFLQYLTQLQVYIYDICHFGRHTNAIRWGEYGFEDVAH